MRLTAFTDYGLRVLMRLAGQPDRAFSTADLAQELRLSRNHLAKVVTTLAGAGLIETRRGGGGGAMLARPADQIRLGDVVALLESGQSLVECLAPGPQGCTLLPQCRLKARLAHAGDAFIADLNHSTLADCLYRPAVA